MWLILRHRFHSFEAFGIIDVDPQSLQVAAVDIVDEPFKRLEGWPRTLREFCQSDTGEYKLGRRGSRWFLTIARVTYRIPEAAAESVFRRALQL